jgi:alpha-tubulin suppressor-like RCC1 family protein
VTPRQFNVPSSTMRHPLHSGPAAVSLLAAFILGCSGDTLEPAPGTTTASLAAGERHACLARATRTWCWGAGSDGQLGVGVTPTAAAPTELPDSIEFVALTAGQFHTCGLDREGLAFCWGSDRDGELGLGAPAAERCGVFNCATRPLPVAGGLRFQALAAGTRSTCGLTTARLVYCWGLNSLGQLGTADAVEQCEDGPCSRTPLAEGSGRSFVSLTAARMHTCALDADGVAFCWGFLAVPVAGKHTEPSFQPNARAIEGVRFRQLSAGTRHTCGVTSDGRAYCWGADAVGAGPDLLEADHPVAVTGGIRFRSVHSGSVSSCGLDDSGAAFCWGANASGEVGTTPVGGTQVFDHPVAVSGGLTFRALEAGSSTYCGITDDERIACWGRGEFGELGAGNANSVAPVFVAGVE